MIRNLEANQFSVAILPKIEGMIKINGSLNCCISYEQYYVLLQTRNAENQKLISIYFISDESQGLVLQNIGRELQNSVADFTNLKDM